MTTHFHLLIQTPDSNLPRVSNHPRDLAVYIASRIAGFPHVEVKQHFGIGSVSAVTEICNRTVHHFRTTPYLKHVLRSLVL